MYVVLRSRRLLVRCLGTLQSIFHALFQKKKLNQIKVEFCHANSFFFNATPLLYSYFFIACSFTYSRYLSTNVGVIGKSNQSIYVSSLVIYIVKCKKWFLMNWYEGAFSLCAISAKSFVVIYVAYFLSIARINRHIFTVLCFQTKLGV